MKTYENGEMAAKGSLTNWTSLMLGYDGDETQLVLAAFYSDEPGMGSNVELTKLLPLTTQADRSGGLRVCTNLKQS